MHRSRRLLAAGALFLSVTLVAAACGGSSTDDDPGADGPATPDDSTPQLGGTLTFGLEAESSGGFCIPEAQLAAPGIAVANAIYDPLMTTDENFEIQPYLAESITANADSTEFTFKIRDGITFHDGSALTAEVVKLNFDIQRGDDAATTAAGRSPLLFPIVYDNIADVTVTEPLTVVVTTTVPWVAFPTYMATGRFLIAAEAQLTAEDCEENMIGTGPFKLDSWVRNQQMELSKNESYWRTDADGTQLPYLDNLVFVPIDASSERLQALEAGTINSAQFTSASVMTQVEEQSDEFGLVTEPAGHHEVGYSLINTAAPPFDDEEFRRHFAMALDREAMADVQNEGKFEIAQQPFDSEVTGFVDGLVLTEYDPDTAADYFADKDATVSISYATDPINRALTEEMQRQLAEVGVEVTIDVKDQSTLINQALTGDFGVLIWRNHPGQDPDGQYVWWHSTSPVNFGKINSPELDGLLDQGRSELDPDTRKGIYEQIAELFASETFNFWHWYSEWGFAHANDVHQLGYYTLPDGSVGAGMNWGWTLWSEVWVEQ